MNETIHAQFYVETQLYDAIQRELKTDYGFILLNGPENFTDGGRSNWTLFSGKIEAQAATLLKLRNVFIADRMVISMITKEMKDRYRS